MSIRSNATLWRLAKVQHADFRDYTPDWDDLPTEVKNWYYDRVLATWLKQQSKCK